MYINTNLLRKDIKILLLENISEKAKENFEANGFQNVEILKTALTEEELLLALKDVHILGIRSKTQLTKKVLDAAPHLMAVACFCIGTNQVDLEAAKENGIAVFNSPFSNTRSVAELIIASSIMLLRKVPLKSKAAHAGKWLKDNIDSYEARGKKIGIVGYGHIGTQVSIMAEAMGMQVYYYDIESKLPLGNAQKANTLEELIAKSDIVSLHVPETAQTKNLLSKEKIALFRKGQYLLNLSRGNVVDIDALKIAIEKGIIAGVAIDVFPLEPKNKEEKFVSPLQDLPNVILTPHIGGSTEEAQKNIGLDASQKLIDYMLLGASAGSHSIPQLALPTLQASHRILHIHHNKPGVLSKINQKISEQNINIVGQFLSTDFSLGYVALDIDIKNSKHIKQQLQAIEHTIALRIIHKNTSL